MPGAVVQIGVATAMGAAARVAVGLDAAGAGLVLGLALSVASTVVVLRALEERSAVRKRERPHRDRVAGRRGPGDGADAGAAAGAGGMAGATPAAGRMPGRQRQHLALLMAITLVKIAVLPRRSSASPGPRVVPWMLRQAARTGSHELFTLAVLAVSIGIAYGAVGALRRVVRARRVLRRRRAEQLRAEPSRRRGSRCRCSMRSP